MQQSCGGNIVPGRQQYFHFHTRHKACVFCKCENKNMKIFSHLYCVYKTQRSILETKFSDNCKKYSYCSTNSKSNSAYCSSTNSHCEMFYSNVGIKSMHAIPPKAFYTTMPVSLGTCTFFLSKCQWFDSDISNFPSL